MRLLLEAIERELPLQFVQSGRFDSISRPVFNKSEELSDLGFASHNSSVISKTYLISERGMKINAEELASAPIYAFDQLYNPKTVAFTPGGLWKNNMLIKGSVGTASKDADSLKIQKIFNKYLKRLFRNIRGNYVGPEAEILWKRGTRLTAAEQSPAEYGLTLTN